jgi:hypothetical protein
VEHFREKAILAQASQILGCRLNARHLSLRPPPMHENGERADMRADVEHAADDCSTWNPA